MRRKRFSSCPSPLTIRTTACTLVSRHQLLRQKNKSLFSLSRSFSESSVSIACILVQNGYGVLRLVVCDVAGLHCRGVARCYRCRGVARCVHCRCRCRSRVVAVAPWFLLLLLISLWCCRCRSVCLMDLVGCPATRSIYVEPQGKPWCKGELGCILHGLGGCI